MLALCLILSITHYAQTYAGIKAVPARNSYIFCLNYPAILFIIGIASIIASYIAIVSYIAI